MGNLRLRIVLALSIAVALLTFVSFGQTATGAAGNGEKKADSQKAEASAAQAPAGGGVVVFIDPATGKIRQPEPGEIGALLQQSSPAAASALTGTTLIRGPGNAIGMKLDDSFASFAVATKGADGKLVTDCVTGAKNAEAKVNSAGQAPQPGANKGVPDVK